jgi:gamma-glutamylcyclotransferase (GGCT)/AIG2-like uncharacterized protein YtfP
MNRDSTYAFYGSLRTGMINYRQFKKSLKFMSREVIPGFQMYGMEFYPYAVKTGNPAHLLTVEVFKITNPEVEKSIHELEIDVGYYYDEIKIKEQSIGIYLFEKPGSEHLVKSGDWVEFFGQ